MASLTFVSNLPGINRVFSLARAKGWPYVASWAHRLSGVMLALYAWLHVVTLSSLRSPELFERKMATFAALFSGGLEWLLAVPVIYHSLNGGRLLLYEVYGNRQDRSALNWVLGLSGCYLFLLAVFMIIGKQSVSPLFFWVYIGIGSTIVGYVTVSRLKPSNASLAWKLQRISGAFMLMMIPAHMLFMHLDPAIGRDAQVIISRLDNGFIKLIDLMLLAAVIFHGGYGIRAVCNDYLTTTSRRSICAVAVIGLSIVFGWIGLKLTLFI